MKVQIPPKIKVGNREYRIIIDPHLQLRENLQGLCDHQNLVISIIPQYHECLLDNVLIHEILHAVNCVYLNSKLPEDDIDHLAHGLSQVLQSMGITFKWEKRALVRRIEDNG